jgi:hypothetical protein
MNTVHATASSRSRILLRLIAAAALLLAATTASAARFRESSLFGTFAAVGEGDGATSRSVGTVTYDGEGNVTRSLIVNAPDGNGGRRLLVFESVGTYEINPDGTGTVSVVNQISNGTSNEVTFDIVIQESQPNGKGGQRRATKIYGVQREGGTTVSLVTTSETLIAP